jgi:hypothetical protein
MAEESNRESPADTGIEARAQDYTVAHTVKKEKHWLHSLMESSTETLLRWIFFWERDDKTLGKFVRFLHHAVIYTALIVYVVIHTIHPSYILLCFFWIFALLVWVQHVVTGGCIFSKIEQKLVGDSQSFVDPILAAFHMPITPETTAGIVTMGSSCVMVLLTFELMCRTILNIKAWLP